MRWLFWVLLILVAAIALSLFAGSNEGYVLIVRPPYRLELSVNLLLILFVLTFVFFHVALRLINYARRLPRNVQAYKETKRFREGRAALVEALHALAAGQYSQAEKSASRALELGEDAGLSALVAARASHKLKRKSQRDYYLAEAERLAPEASVARLLTQAESLLDDRQYSHALQALSELNKIEPHYAPALRLELKVQLHLDNWEHVLRVLQQLEKQDAIESWQIRQLRQQSHIQLLKRYSEDLLLLQTYWNNLAQDEQLNTRIAQTAAQAFIDAGNGDQALKVLEMSLTKTWDSDLAELLGECESKNPIRQLQQAEYWLTVQEGDAKLLLALGKMCIRQNLWGKAQSYLEASISVKPSAQAHYTLARMLENRGDLQAATQHYRFSAQLAHSK
ncbi:Protein HemY [Methylophilaceae bacterium]|nr:Protein HemY [Methylophilaceae bacterium]